MEYLGIAQKALMYSRNQRCIALSEAGETSDYTIARDRWPSPHRYQPEGQHVLLRVRDVRWEFIQRPEGNFSRSRRRIWDGANGNYHGVW